MKSFIKLISATLGCVVFTSVFAANHSVLRLKPFTRVSEGGIDGSGGNGFRTTPETVDKVVSLLPNILPKLTTRIEVLYSQMGNESTMSRQLRTSATSEDQDDALVMKVFKAWFGTGQNSPLQEALSHGDVHFVSKDQCFEGADERDGSYLKGEVCLSRARLSGQSANAMVRDIIALSYHELAHHFGFGEQEAHVVQAIIDLMYENTINPTDGPLIGSLTQLLESIDTFSFLENALNGASKVSDQQICYKLGILDPLVGGGLLATASGAYWISSSLFDTMEAQQERLARMQGYCGVAASTTKSPVTAGDRSELLKLLTQAHVIHNSLMGYLVVWLAADKAAVNQSPESINSYSLDTYLEQQGVELLPR